MTKPQMLIRPSDGGMNPVIMRMVVDLPAPFGPRNPSTSPRSIRYLAIIREFDAMMAHLDALWLSCVISDSQYARGVYEWKRRILRLAGQIRQLATRAVLAARRKETASETVAESDGPEMEAENLAADGTKVKLSESK